MNSNYPKDMIKKVDKKRLNLNIIQDDSDITIKFKSKDYVPAFGMWVSDFFTINEGEFLIEDTSLFEWLKENITDSSAINGFIKTMDNRTFEHRSSKEEFYRKADNLELTLVMFKIEDFRKLATEGLERLKSSSTYSSSQANELEKELGKKIDDCKVVYIVRYNNAENEIPSDLNNFELYILKSTKLSDSFETLALLKRCAFDALIGATLTLTIFGTMILAGRYSLSKFF
jgi:hypothetical protein